MPTHVGISADRTGIERDSVILLEQIRTIDKQRLKDQVTHLDVKTMAAVDAALATSVGLVDKSKKKRKRSNTRTT